MFKVDLLDNEKALSVYRQTEAVLFKPVLIILVLIYVPWYFLIRYNLVGSYDRLLILWTILVFLYGLNQYFLWLLNVYILTNQRIIKVNYKNVLNKQVLESPLERILNVSFSIRGFWPSLFGFGAVEVQVAGLGEPMVLKNVGHPAQVKDFLWKTHSKYAGNSYQRNGLEQAQEILSRKAAKPQNNV